MTTSHKSIEILNRFSKFKASGEKTLIESYDLEQLRQATHDLVADKDTGFIKQ